MRSESTGRRYPRTIISAVYRLPRSTWYALGERSMIEKPMVRSKRGPRSSWSDEEILSSIRQVLLESPFHGEGHRKVRARLRARGMSIGRNRVLRIMRENQLLAPVRRMANHGDRRHEGRIQTDRPNKLWGADAARFYTREDGWCWFFGAIDHCSEDIVGWHVAKRGDRWAALEPIRQGIRTHYGDFAKKIAIGLGLRHDWGPQYCAHQFLGELKWLGIRSTPSYVGEPECNGIMERWIRTLKEECLYLHDFASLEEAREVIGEFIRRYNEDWLLERFGYRSPLAIRESFAQMAA
jgi:transposase InsO family protein